MREGIHPAFHQDAKIVCASCGTEWSIGSTSANLRIDICSNCHPFYTGEQRIVDTEGRVEGFLRKLAARDQRAAEAQAKVDAKQNADIPLEELELGTRYVNIFRENGVELVSDLIKKMQEEGDDAILEIPGIGVKVLADAKRRISELGFKLS